jgi:hypothetical protein
MYTSITSMPAQDCCQLVVNQRWQNVVHGFVIIRLDGFGFGVGFNPEYGLSYKATKSMVLP